jgi:hypothetical protein
LDTERVLGRSFKERFRCFGRGFATGLFAAGFEGVAVAQPAQTGSEYRHNLPAAFVGRHLGRVEIGSHGPLR